MYANARETKTGIGKPLFVLQGLEYSSESGRMVEDYMAYYQFSTKTDLVEYAKKKGYSISWEK